MNFLEKVNFLMQEQGLNKRTLSQKSGIPYTTISDWYKKGFENTRISTAKKLANYFGVTLDYLLLDEITDRKRGCRDDDPCYIESSKKQKPAAPKPDTADKIANRYKKLDEHGQLVVCAVVSEEERRMRALQKPEPEDNVIHIHWNDQPASAGEGFDLSDKHMDEWLVRYNELTRRADFCLNVQGHSMEPKFHDGDIALIRQQPAVDVGEIGLFIVDGKGYIKKQGPDRLISLNPDYDDVYSGEFSDTRCVGKVIGVLDPDWIVER